MSWTDGERAKAGSPGRYLARSDQPTSNGVEPQVSHCLEVELWEVGAGSRSHLRKAGEGQSIAMLERKPWRGILQWYRMSQTSLVYRLCAPLRAVWVQRSELLGVPLLCNVRKMSGSTTEWVL